MKTSLAHLPANKQKRIFEFVEIIKEVNPAMIILHGSYATGKQQHDFSMEGHASTEFDSDYDFLVIMNDGEDIRDMSLTERLNNRFHRSGPVDIMVHSADQVNRSLERGHYFFNQIISDGILLYDTGKLRLSRPKELSLEELKEISHEYFDYWFPLSQKYLQVAILYFQKALIERDRFNFSMYNLFLAVEGLYTTVALVFTGYKPKTHNLDKLRKYTKGISQEFDSIFPKNPKDRYDADLFDLLKRSYVGAKYKMDFYIPQKDLALLIKKTERMMSIVEGLCKDWIKQSGDKYGTS